MSSPAFCISRHLLTLQTDSRTSQTMAICLTLAIFLTTFILVQSDESPSAMDDASSLPMLASGKRQHNIMRFGKRPSLGPIEFEKREDPRHRFLFMGKREDGLLHFLQGDDNSYKRGHTIMRFGKRKIPQETHNFMRFGRKAEDEEDEKRGHSMIYFGKRSDGHNMMYFGKRAGHSMMYFGKRENDDDYYSDPENVSEEDKRAAHSMIHFGKREEDSKRAAHSMIHFGKRLPQEDENDEAHFPMHQEFDVSDKRNHNLLRFGKKTEGSRARGTHAMIHFGKRSLAGNQTEGVVTRTKRNIEEEEDEIPSALVWDENPGYVEYTSEPEKKEGSKNVFLRFG